MIRFNSLTTEYIYWPITDTDLEIGDETEAQIAFKSVNALGVSAEPTEGDWISAVIADKGDNTYDIALMVGPSGGYTLSPGLYRVWVRITDTEERPVRPIDYLVIM